MKPVKAKLVERPYVTFDPVPLPITIRRVHDLEQSAERLGRSIILIEKPFGVE